MAEIPVAAIQTRGLTRDFGAGRGLFDLDLEVRPGEAYGYLGPNGAGKSTTLRLLMGLIRPTSGSATIFGVDVTRDPVRVKAMVGYLPGELAQFGDMRGGQVLSLLAGLRGGVSAADIRTLAKRLGLDLSRHYREYSRGNKQKLAVVAALMAKPRVLILDEPTSGLDPLVQQEFYRLIAEAREAGATVFMSSHVFAEVEHTCSRVGIIRDGRLIRDGDLQEIHSMRVHRVTISFEGDLDADALNRIQGVSQARVHGSLLTCHVQGDFDPLLRAISGLRVTNLVSQEPSLEEVFLAYYADESAVEPVAASEPEPETAPEPVTEPVPATEPPPESGADTAPPTDAESETAPGHQAPDPGDPEAHHLARSAFRLRDWLGSELESGPQRLGEGEKEGQGPELVEPGRTDPSAPAPGPAEDQPPDQ
ncbi:MAG TPA: ATP-binding cassette domain-containing protein [Candidatus Solibacter sp.]|nr:ATP-binding cassette domain-containing protein [Candidatus Solibacter sp.]